MQQLKEIGFSLWCDFVERDFLKERFGRMLHEGAFNGATSNPSIFKEAFLNSPAYKEEIRTLQGKNPKDIYETLATEDIRSAAQALLPLYKKGEDGFISIEIDPLLGDDVEGSLEEAYRLWDRIAMPNVMIKVPATKAGFEVMERLISKAIPVNATLIFSPDQAEGCLDAFEQGYATLKQKNPDTPMPKAVISVFVSRFDRKINATLNERDLPKNLLGIYNATRIYHLIEKRNNPHIRTLFASTGVKGDDLKADYYIKALLYPHSVNTAPLATIEAFLENGDFTPKTPLNLDEIEIYFKKLKNADIEIEDLYHELLDEGMDAFKKAFEEILSAL